MAVNLRRLKRKASNFTRNRVASVDNLFEERNPVVTENKIRSQSEKELNLTGVTDCSGVPRKMAWKISEGYLEDSNKLTEEWMNIWQIPPALPFGQSEFERRVEAVKSIVVTEMDVELERDMRNYKLNERRQAVCKEMLSSPIEKAARTLGILGC